jgi:transcriptional regulator GlxA family with amidase domain
MSFKPRRVAIFIFNDVEVLDFCGPLEVFGVTEQETDPKPFDVVTVAATPGVVVARNQLSVNPMYSFENCPPADIVLIPGGVGTRPLIHNIEVLHWIQDRATTSEYVLSVCTGALLLAKAGLLDGLAATTHHTTVDLLRQLAPHTDVREGDRVIDNGKIVLSAGVAAGIDMSLYMVSRLLGEDAAIATATEMEYDWRPGQHSVYQKR